MQTVELSKNLAAEGVRPTLERAIPVADQTKENAGITIAARRLKENILDNYEQGLIPPHHTPSRYSCAS